MDKRIADEVIAYKSGKGFPPLLNRTQRMIIRRRAASFVLQGNELYYKGNKNRMAKVVISAKDAAEIFQSLHVSPGGAHHGITKTVNVICRSYYWPSMTVDIYKWVSECLQCQEKNTSLKQSSQYPPKDDPNADKETQKNFRFSLEENDVLITNILEHYDNIYGKFATETSTEEKNEIWRNIVNAVNSVSTYPRTILHCKKRFSDIKRNMKQKLCKQARFPPPLSFPLWPYEQKMKTFLTSGIVEGIKAVTDITQQSEDEAGHASHAVEQQFQAIRDTLVTECKEDSSNGSAVEDNFSISLEDEAALNSMPVNANYGSPVAISAEGAAPCEANQQVSAARLVSPAQASEMQQTGFTEQGIMFHEEQRVFRHNLMSKMNYMCECIKSLTQAQREMNQILLQKNTVQEKIAANMQLIAQQQLHNSQQIMSTMHQALEMFRTQHQTASGQSTAMDSLNETSCASASIQ
ncbi:uncharacterized protein LOC128666429 [Bombina bombina]|uniref:uncharacterized protein LOC128666429 n=1 Tax=Bombina bombina TaxID=8345 RepID=UPI00235AFF72|nr:uncharacterized protein LOC128666429 [Bombina bombina]